MKSSSQILEQPGFRPLYQQVRELLVSRISTGAWKPAEALPSEVALAQELNVSQGTVRKAIDSLVTDKLVERRQGKGTYVAKHTSESAHFRFFKLSLDDGSRALPTCEQSVIKRKKASAEHVKKLNLSAKSDVYEITRTRHVDEKPVLREQIVIAFSKFKNLDSFHPLPNTLYTLYQEQFNVSVNSTDEKIKAVPADALTALELRVELGTPLLRVERIAFDVSGGPVELRVTHVLTDDLSYVMQLS